MERELMKTPEVRSAGLGVLGRVVGSAAALCGVHCLLTPAIVLVLPALALSEVVERWVLLGTAASGFLIVGLGPARHRGRILAILSAGVAFWFASLGGWLEPAPEAVTSAAGSLVVAGALLWSARLCRTGGCEV
jgi:hypothetical protein